MTLGPGSRLGNYTITRSLGSGGMADVYEAHDETLERTVALKVLPLEYTRNPQLVARFQKEVRAAAKLNHRNIVTVFEVGHQDSYHYFSMRLLTGGDLRKRIEAGLTSLEALAILRELADAFAHAHARGFIHRDVKPENVMFDEQGFPVLTDFGIAKALDANTHMTRTGMTMGTPRYLSPEQASGKPVDARADLYSLGVMLFEMLTGRPPYDAEESMAVIFKHVTEPIPTLPDDFTRFQPLLEKLMAKDPKQRLGSAEELIRAIDELAPKAPTRELPSQVRTAENPLLAGLLTPSPLRTPAPKTPRPVTPAPVTRPPAGGQSGEVVVAPPVTTREIFTRRPAPAPAAAAAPAPAPVSTPVRGVAQVPQAQTIVVPPPAPTRRLSPGVIGMVAGGVVAVVTTAWALRSFVTRPDAVSTAVMAPAPAATPDAERVRAEKAAAERREQARQTKLREQEQQRKAETEAAQRRQQEQAQAQARQEQLRREQEAAALRDAEARQRVAAEADAKKQAEADARRRAEAKAEAQRRTEAETAARRQREQEAAEQARREQEQRVTSAAAARQPEAAITGPHSARGTAKVRFTVVNDCRRAVDVVWIDYEGKPQGQGSIDPGANKSFDSYASHLWRIFEKSRRRTLLRERTLAAAEESLNVCDTAQARQTEEDTAKERTRRPTGF